MVIYKTYAGLPDHVELEEVLQLHKHIFGDCDGLVEKMTTKPQLLIQTAWDHNHIVGYKMGYELGAHTFYSWLGGVREEYRKHGIASELMKKQHQFLRESGYETVRTKTKNKWRGMLILNIKNGFDVIEVQSNETGELKIILEKKLVHPLENKNKVDSK